MGKLNRMRIALGGLALGVVLTAGLVRVVAPATAPADGALLAARVKDPPEPKPGGGRRVQPLVQRLG